MAVAELNVDLDERRRAILSIRVVFSIDPFLLVFIRCCFLPMNGKRSRGGGGGGGGGNMVKVNKKLDSATAPSRGCRKLCRAGPALDEREA